MISTKTCATSASMSFARLFVSSSPGKTCRDSSARSTGPGRDDECNAELPIHRSLLILPSRKAVTPRPSRGRSDGSQPGPATAVGGYFPPQEGYSNRRGCAAQNDQELRLCSAKQNSL